MSSCRPFWSIPHETSHVKIGDGADSPYEDLSNQSQIETKSRVNQTQGIGGIPLPVGDWVWVECEPGIQFYRKYKKDRFEPFQVTELFFNLYRALEKIMAQELTDEEMNQQMDQHESVTDKRWTNLWINMKQWVWRVPHVRKSSLEL